MSTSASSGADVSGLPSICSSTPVIVRPAYRVDAILRGGRCGPRRSDHDCQNGERRADANRHLKTYLMRKSSPNDRSSFLDRIQEI